MAEDERLVAQSLHAGHGHQGKGKEAVCSQQESGDGEGEVDPAGVRDHSLQQVQDALQG